MAKNKDGSFRVIGVFFLITILITMNWNKWGWLKNSIHSAFDPTLGALLSWNLEFGMLIILFVLAVIMTFVQKYTTNQEELKEIRKTQKELQAEAKKHQNNPKKSMEIQKELMSLMPKQMKLGMRTIVYTVIPLILFFRWFNDYFLTIGSPKFFGFIGWFIFYIVFFMLFSTILKKKFDVV